MEYTVARLVHRPAPLDVAAATPTLAAAPGILRRVQPHMRADTPEIAAWNLVDPEGAHRDDSLRPLCLALAHGERGRIAILLGVDGDGALFTAWREQDRTVCGRATDGGANDPAWNRAQEVLGHGQDLRGIGPVPHALDLARCLHGGLTPELVHRSVPLSSSNFGHPTLSIAHPWHDATFAATALRHGADQRLVRRDPEEAGGNWVWMGSDPRLSDGKPITGTISGLPATMPFFSLTRIAGGDQLVIWFDNVTYERQDGIRTIIVAEGTLPDTVLAAITAGMPARVLCDMPGVDDQVVAEVVEEADIVRFRLEDAP